MTLKSLVVENFGLFCGRHEIALSPRSKRPVILFHGLNGSGKSTLAEAIRIGLHGINAFRDRKTTAQYISYIRGRIHRPRTGSQDWGECASVALEFEYVVQGQKNLYALERTWRVEGDQLEETVELTENGSPIPDLDPKMVDTHLRDLVPTEIAETFFFDGEKLDLLTDDSTWRALFERLSSRLFGIDAVDRLRKDLEVVLSKTEPGEGSASGERLRELRREHQAASDLLADYRHRYAAVQKEIVETQKAIELQTRSIESNGGDYAVQQVKLQNEAADHRRKLESRRRAIHEHFTGLAPFAFSPGLLRRLAERLVGEGKQEKRLIAEEVLERQLEALQAYGQRNKKFRPLEAEVIELVSKAIPYGVLSSEKPLLGFSEGERLTLLGWIEAATGSVLSGLLAEAEGFRKSVNRIKKAESDLKRVPLEVVLDPLLDTLRRLEAKLTSLKSEELELVQGQASVEQQVVEMEGELRRQMELVSAEKSSSNVVTLTLKVQPLLEVYKQRVLEKKLADFSARLSEAFNELSRKKDYIDSITIEPASLNMMIKRHGRLIDRGELSAGEKQVLALSIMLALLKVSGVPMPVIMDTPFGRLDSYHRRHIIETFLPQCSHQVLVLATDTELTPAQIQSLSGHASASYELTYELKTGSSRVTPLNFEKVAF